MVTVFRGLIMWMVVRVTQVQVYQLAEGWLLTVLRKPFFFAKGREGAVAERFAVGKYLIETSVGCEDQL